MFQPAAAKGSRLRDRIYQIMPQISSTQHPACQRRRPTIYGADRATPLTLPPVAPENNRIACSRALVPGAGLEPTRPCGQGILSPQRLPITPPGQHNWRRGSESNRRTRLCRPLHDHSATPPTRLSNRKGKTEFRRRLTCRCASAKAIQVEANSQVSQSRNGTNSVFPRILERETRLELATSTLARLRSTN